MRGYCFPLTIIAVALALVFPSYAAEKPHPAQGNQSQPKKIWTNEDMDELRMRGLISIIGQEPQEITTPPVEVVSSGPVFPMYSSRLEDPEWYAEKAAELRAELDRR